MKSTSSYSLLARTVKAAPALALFGACLLLPCSSRAAALKVAWTPYPSWQILPASTLNLDGKGSFLSRRMVETKGHVDIVKFKEYTVSCTALAAGEIDACAMTLQEALSFPVDSGVPVTVILVNDYSNGNDALFGPKGSKIADLATNGVLLEEFSVSQFLVYSACLQAGLDPKKIVIKNTPGDEIPKVFLPAKKKPYAATWNPHVVRIIEDGNAEVLFTSKEIPGQIVDAIVIRNDRLKDHEADIEALIKAYYDFIHYWQTPATAEKALRALASTADMKSNEDVELFRKTVATTHFYYTPKETADFMDGKEIRVAHDKIRTALISFKAFKGEHPENYQVQIDSTWVKKAIQKQ